MSAQKRSKSPIRTRSDQYERDNAKRIQYNQDMADFNQAMEKEVYGEHPHLSRYRTKKEYDEMMAEYKVRYDDAMASKRDAINNRYDIPPVAQEELLTGNYATAIKKEKAFAARNKEPIRPFGLSDDPLPEPSIYNKLTDNVAKVASTIKDGVRGGVDGLTDTAAQAALKIGKRVRDAVKYTTGKGPSKSPKLGRDLTPSYKEAMDDWENDMKVWEAAKDEYAAKNKIYKDSGMTKEQYDRWMKDKHDVLPFVGKDLIEQKFPDDRPGIHPYNARTVNLYNTIIDEIAYEDRKFQPFYKEYPQPVKPEEPEEQEKECDEEGVCVISGGKTRKAKKSKKSKAKKAKKSKKSKKSKAKKSKSKKSKKYRH